MKAIILAAGEGKRLRPLTEKTPKPMLKIKDKPLLEYAVDLCKKYGINDLAINTSYLPNQIKDYFGDGKRFRVKFKFSYESELLGTSGALNNFRDFLTDNEFLVFYGDNLTNLNLKKMIDFHKKENAFGTIYLYHEKFADSETTPGCVVVNEGGLIKKIIENPTKSEEKYLGNISRNYKFTNSGIYILKKGILDLIPFGKSDFATEIFPEILKRGLKLCGYQEHCYIIETGQIHRYLKAKKEIESGKIKL